MDCFQDTFIDWNSTSLDADDFDSYIDAQIGQPALDDLCFTGLNLGNPDLSHILTGSTGPLSTLSSESSYDSASSSSTYSNITDMSIPLHPSNFINPDYLLSPQDPTYTYSPPSNPSIGVTVYSPILDKIYVPIMSPDSPMSESPPAPQAGKKDAEKRKHVCPVCHHAFARSWNLQSHKRKHDPNWVKPFVCHHEVCGRGFNRKHDLSRHLATRHREVSKSASSKSRG
ncbi:hypothetical protein BD779DRAFT_1483987 [Infundibulicybe gibba]|nr:hypothetical protein BD779DRAFT_1483987 [Infundibulicybe gibba]